MNNQDFPILKTQINSHKLVYLDNAATTQKPQVVIDTLSEFYEKYNANIHRAIHYLGEISTQKYEDVRDKVAKMIGSSREEIIFTKNTTESINLVAYTWVRQNINKDDVIVISEMEHHSNIVPWQELCKEKGCKLEWAKIDSTFRLNLDHLFEIIKTNSKTKLVSITHVSNVLGTINHIEYITQEIRKINPEIKILIDGAQSIPCLNIDIKKLNCNFFVFSAHKMMGPTGIGVLYAKKELLDKMPPFLLGGDMIREVHKDKTIWNDLPWKFEAGTPNIADVIAFGAAIDYRNSIGIENIEKHEFELAQYGIKKLRELDFVKIIGPQVHFNRLPIFSFAIEGIHPHDIAQILNDEAGIAIRSGYHCAEPLHDVCNLKATSRASLYIYNTKEEIDLLCKNLINIRESFNGYRSR